MIGVEDDARVRVHAAEKTDGVGADQGFALGPAPAHHPAFEDDGCLIFACFFH